MSPGGSHTYEVLPAIPTEPDQKKEEEETKKQTKEEEEEEDNEETVVTETIKRKLFTGTKAQGLRVRAQPSFAAAAVGLIKPGYVLCYTDQVNLTVNYNLHNVYVHIHVSFCAFLTLCRCQ